MAENNRCERERKRNRAKRTCKIFFFFFKLLCGKWNGSGTERLSGGFDEDCFFDGLCGVWRVACGVENGKGSGKGMD